MKLRLVVPLALAIACGVARAQGPDDLAKQELEELMELDVIPLDVLGAHLHPKGEWMVGYRYMTMPMSGLSVARSDVSATDVLERYAVTPTRMTMEMHMVELMYGATDRLTLMAMFPYLSLSMDHITRMGAAFTTRSQGSGDIQLMADYELSSGRRHRFLYLGALSLPTGSIDETGDTPAGRDQPLPYPMQLGSGTYDLMQGMSYLGESGNWAWGSELRTRFRLGTNARGYKLGDRIDTSGWIVRRLTEWVAASVKVGATGWGSIEGSDPRLNPQMVPTAEPANQGGWRTDLIFGLSFYVPRGPLEKNRLYLNVPVPVHQDLNGPQLQSDTRIELGWQWRF